MSFFAVSESSTNRINSTSDKHRLVALNSYFQRGTNFFGKYDEGVAGNPHELKSDILKLEFIDLNKMFSFGKIYFRKNRESVTRTNQSRQTLSHSHCDYLNIST